MQDLAINLGMQLAICINVCDYTFARLGYFHHLFSFNFGDKIQLRVCATGFQDGLEKNKLMNYKEKHFSSVSYG